MMVTNIVIAFVYFLKFLLDIEKLWQFICF